MRNLIKEYAAYLRDNPQGYWFKARWFGWGWVPARWQGWLVIAVFLVFVLWASQEFTASGENPSQGDLIWFFGRVVGAVVLLIVIAYRTGEKPGWHWGPPKDDTK